MDIQNREMAMARQRSFCEAHGIPTCFIPPRGYCPHCGIDIFSVVTPEESARRFISGCPNCHHSFVA